MKLLVGGVLALLILCLWLFSGSMVPAMWQLLSEIWIVCWLYFFWEGETK